MGAPEHAEPIGTEDWQDKQGNPVDPADLPDVVCACGWKGSVTALVVVDESETMWCPHCGTTMWEYA